jgi:hypothetical protein
MFNLYEAAVTAENQRKEFMREADNRRLVRQLRRPRAFRIGRLSLPQFLSIPVEEDGRAVAAQRSEAC